MKMWLIPVFGMPGFPRQDGRLPNRRFTAFAVANVGGLCMRHCGCPAAYTKSLDLARKTLETLNVVGVVSWVEVTVDGVRRYD